MVSQRGQRGVKARAKWHLGGGLACGARGQAAAHRNPNERAGLEMTCNPALGTGEVRKSRKRLRMVIGSQSATLSEAGWHEACAWARSLPLKEVE